MDDDLQQEELSAARHNALNLLSRREHSQRELRQKLMQRDYSVDVVDSVIERLLQEDFLSDSRYSESYIRMRSAKGYGLLRIYQELRERGVDKTMIDKALAESDIDWAELLQRTHDKKFPHSSPADARERARRMRFLQQRGFGLDLIHEFFKKFV